MNTKKDKKIASKKPNRLGEYKYSNAAVLRAIQGTGGIVAMICKKLGCERSTFYRYVSRRPLIAQALEDEKENVLDMAEGSLMGLTKGGELGAICFYLKCKGKGRGYVEKQEIDMSLKEPPKINIILQGEDGPETA